MSVSNTRECFSDRIGHKVIGVIFDIGKTPGCKTLVFDDGYGLTISNNGSYWVESPSIIEQAIASKKQELERLQHDLEQILHLAGAL